MNDPRNPVRNTARNSAPNDFRSGVRYLGRGQRWVLGRPRLYARCLLPALAVFVVYAAALVALALHLGELAALITPFADDWEDGGRTAIRIAAGLALLGVGLLLAVVTFTTVTLLVGDPLYDALSVRIEEGEAAGTGIPVPEGPDRPLWRELAISLRESLGTLAWTLLLAVPVLLVGLVPFAGQVFGFVLGTAVAGWFLTAELTAYALQRRGLGLRERLRLVAGRRRTALGFGMPLVVLFLIPGGAVLFMPGAVAGATLLARDIAPETPAAPAARATPTGPVPGAGA
ncbi:EI24 domain-containing protein [Streptomyces sp. ST2-7A]|uniref:EI24 domain-containing protein n=1 Tax=Streptomyces sp. ST2-7A TaxID=2907214 RepID=UPI001F372A4D|nr:EI24 domain-containing protein [Streptomyces sp. ST2-7A]MCE7082411.1 EI24 domain-containing protein [Streptomyces sp. ST2-7A]